MFASKSNGRQIQEYTSSAPVPANVVGPKGSFFQKVHGIKKILILFILSFALSLSIYITFLKRTGNFHEVAKGAVYRSGQMSYAQLDEKHTQLRFRSVLNLRGRAKNRAWYDDEVTFCQKAGVHHYDIALSAGKDLSQGEMNKIVALLKNAPKPLLIHCKDGADRAGLTSALYRLAVENKSISDAAGELSVWYGHIPMFTPHVAAMDRSLKQYAKVHSTAKATR